MNPQAIFVVRDSTETDISRIGAIYAHWVRNGLASFELEPPSSAQIAHTRSKVLGDGFPYLVVVDSADVVQGYAYASWYRTRLGYRFTCEDSVYVAPDAIGQGIGRRLLDDVIIRTTAMGMRLMIAVIGDSGNEPSIALHRRAGFKEVGVFPSIGWKHERWVDSVLMARPLGEGNSSAPVEHGRLMVSSDDSSDISR